MQSQPPSSAPLQWRILWTYAIILPLYAGYLLTNHYHWREPTVLPLTAVDRAIPFLPWTVWPYLLLAGCIPLCMFIKARGLFVRTLRAMVLGYSLNLLCFLIFPTALPRGGLPGDVHGAGLAWLYSYDSPANCFPSGHITGPGVSMLGLAVAYPRWRGALGLAFILLAPTILTTKQHYFIDLPGGMLTVALGWWASGWCERTPSAPHPVFNGGLFNLIQFRRSPLVFLEKLSGAFYPYVHCRLAWLSTYLITDAQLAQSVLKLSHTATNKHTRSTSLINRVVGPTLLTLGGDSWFHRRRLLQPAFHAASMGQYESALRASVDELLADWQGKSMAVLPAMRQLTFRFICRVIFAQENAVVTSKLESAVRVLLAQTWQSIESPSDWRLRINQRRRRAFDEALQEVRDYVRQAIHQATVEPLAHSLLQQLLAMQDAETGERMPHEALVDECLSMMLAGYEATASALAWGVLLLAAHPAEADAVRSGGSAAARYAFLETLRLYPAFWLIERNLETPLSTAHGTIPIGAQLLISPWALHRDERLWPQPLQFMPERFQAEVMPAAFIPFGAGPRSCIGRGLAMLEGQVVLSMLTQAGELSLSGSFPEPQAAFTLSPGESASVRLLRPASP